MTLPPETMTAVEITAPGGPDVLRPCTRPTPAPGHEEILIEIAFAGVNRPDALQRAGAYPPPPGASDLPGLEASGRVASVGAGVTRWAVGDAVCALLPGGGYAEYAVTHQDHALPAPAGLSMAEAAATPETAFTVWSNVFDRGRLAAGEVFLVHGGSSGIGTMAIQLAARAGARVFATAGSAEKCAACVALGAERAFNYREEDFVAALHEATDGHGADLILDMVGGDYIPRNIAAAADDGRIVLIAFLGGDRADLSFGDVLRRRLTITGSTLRPRSVEFKAAVAAALHGNLWPLLESGAVRPIMDQTFSLEDASAAHTRMESSMHVGKIVLSTGR